MKPVKQNPKRKSQNQNLSGESQNKIHMSDIHGGNYTVPRVSSKDSQSDNQQPDQINHSTPKSTKVSQADYKTTDGTGLSPLGPEGP